MSAHLKTFFVSFLILTTLTGFGCKTVSPAIANASKPIALTMWGVFDDQDAYSTVIADYRQAHPYVQITYRKLRPEEYESELLNAFAEDRGPDIFMVHNTWIHGYLPKIAPLPKIATIAELVTTGTIQKTTTYELHQKNAVSLRQFQTAFPDQVVRDAVITTQTATGPVQTIVAIPLSIDTLALYWNKELMNAAGIAQPPVTWTDVQTMVKKLVKTDDTGAITQAGIAIGTQKNVVRATDILSLLMTQNMTQMADVDGNPTFNQMPQSLTGHALPPGIEALIFYTDFANPGKDVYNWNDTMPNSLDAFVTGQTAMFMGYNYELPIIRARAPKLKFDIAAAPQIPGNPQRNFANYWLNTVSKKSKHIDAAWDFIQFMTSEPEAKKYLDKTQKPTALRSLIPTQIDNVDVGVFANQILTAENWYHGANATAEESAMNDMIDAILAGTTPELSINTANDRVSLTISPPPVQ